MQFPTRRTLAPTLALLAGFALLQGCSGAEQDEAATPPAEDTTQMPAEPAPMDPAPAPVPPATDPMPTDPATDPAADPSMPPPADGTANDAMSDQPQPAEPVTPPTDS